MDKELLWILKKVSAHEISAESADRLIRALKLLEKSEDGEIAPTDNPEDAEQSSTEEIPQEEQEIISPIEEPSPSEESEIEIQEEDVEEIQEDEQEVEEEVDEGPPVEIEEEPEPDTIQKDTPLVEVIEVIEEEIEIAQPHEHEEEETPPEIISEAVEAEKTMDEADTVPFELVNKDPLLNENGIGFIEDIPDGAKISVEKSGSIMIRGWDEPYLRAEGEGNLATFLWDEELLKIEDESEIHLTLYLPLAIGNMGIISNSGSISVENYPGDIFVDSNTGNIELTNVTGNIDLTMAAGNVNIKTGSLENIKVAIADGKVEMNVEKLSSGAIGQISVFKGDITVGLPTDFGCDLVARGSRKSMYIELPVQIIEKDKDLLRGKLSGGGPKLELIAADGEIRLQALGLMNTQDNATKIDSNMGLS